MTLLPYASFRQSVDSYSDVTLYKMLKIMLASQDYISQHGAHSSSRERRNIWYLWGESEQAYIRLTLMCTEKAMLRDIPFDTEAAKRLYQRKKGKHWRKPLWVGWERLHSSHRAALMQAGEIEQISCRIIGWKHLENKPKLFQWEYTFDWFGHFHFSRTLEGNSNYNNEIRSYLTEEGAPLLDTNNHYDQFNWTERPNGNGLVWPLEPGENWICEP